MKDYEVNDAVVEIKDQDLEAQEAGAGGYKTTAEAIRLTYQGKCGMFFTVSYECNSAHISC